MTFFNLLLILGNTLLLVCGQFLWKFGLQGRHIATSDGSLFRLFLSPFIVSGLAIYGLATLLWFYILSRVDISIAYPIQSIAYVLVIIGAYYLFDEPMNTYKMIGCILIVAGVTVIGLSSRMAG